MMASARGAQQPVRIWWAVTACLLLSVTAVWPADKMTGMLLVREALTGPNQPIDIEAKLIRKGMLGDAALGGEPLELVQSGRVIAKAMTGGDGRALLRFTPSRKGIVTLTVRVGDSPRVATIEVPTTIAVWELRTPILAVEVAALMEEAAPSSALPSLPLGQGALREPMPDAADELGKLSRFYYNLMYVMTKENGRSDGFTTTEQIRAWLKAHKFPPGYILVLSHDTGAVGTKLDELHAAGWKTLKVGIGRSKTFVEAFLQRRLEAVMVPEPAKGNAPRKAKVAKVWKEVRKKL